MRPELYSDRFRRLSRQAGLRVIHLHLVSHTLAVAMNRAGVAPVDAAPPLGHTVDVYVSTYLRPSEQGARRWSRRRDPVWTNAEQLRPAEPMLRFHQLHATRYTVVAVDARSAAAGRPIRLKFLTACWHNRSTTRV